MENNEIGFVVLGAVFGFIAGWVADWALFRRSPGDGLKAHHGLLAPDFWTDAEIASAAAKILDDRHRQKQVDLALGNSEAGRVYDPPPGGSTGNRNGKPTLVS